MANSVATRRLQKSSHAARNRLRVGPARCRVGSSGRGCDREVDVEMQFDNVIQIGVWVGSLEQIECLRQTARDADFSGYNSIEQYLEQIESTHNEEDTDGQRGPIDGNARARYEVLFGEAWERLEST